MDFSKFKFRFRFKLDEKYIALARSCVRQGGVKIRQQGQKWHRDFRRIVPDTLMARYTMALIAIGALLFLDQAVVQISLRHQVADQKIARLLELQQFDSVRLNRAILTLQLATREDEIHSQTESLLEIISEISKRDDEIQSSLTENRGELWPHLKNEAEVLRQSFHQMSLGPQNRMSRAIERPLRAADRYALRTALQDLQTISRDYRQSLHEALEAVDHLMQGRMISATRIEFGLFALLLVVLFLEGFYIFRPSLRGLESALRTRSDFMSRMSHEIRNPMNAIMGMTDVLNETPLNDLQKRYLGVLSRSSQTLLDLLNNLLDFSALESGKTKIERIQFDLSEVLEKVIDVSAVRAHEKNLEILLDIHPQTPLKIWGDPVRLQQVLANLVSNAIKFTEKGEVRLSVTPVNGGSSEMSLSYAVVDTGIGIPSQSLGRIFESFVQAETSTRRHYGGSGLGLTISKDLVQLMGGQLRVKSDLGKGSEFEFTLPNGNLASSSATPTEPSQTLAERMALCDLNEMTVLCLGAQSSPMKQAMGWIKQCGGRIEDRIESVDLDSPHSLILVSPQGDESVLQFFPERLPPKMRVLCILGTMVSAQRMRSYMNFGVTEFVLTPLKPIDFVETVQRGAPKPESQLAGNLPALDFIEDVKMRILVADDVKENRDLISLYLGREPVDLVTVADGAQAVQKFQSEKIDLVLMDVQMPVLDGVGALHSIRGWEQSQRRAAVPIVAITADDRPEQQQELLAQGFDGILAKPLRKSRLIELIRSLKQAAAGARQKTDDIVL